METEDVEPDLDSLRERVESALGSSLEEEWAEVLDQWSSAAPASRTAVRSDLLGLRNRLLNRIMEMSSLDGLRQGLAVQYGQVKCRWLMMTMKIQHQTLRHGGADEQLICRATCVSLLVQSLEPLLHQPSMSRLTEVLDEPIT